VTLLKRAFGSGCRWMRVVALVALVLSSVTQAGAQEQPVRADTGPLSSARDPRCPTPANPHRLYVECVGQTVDFVEETLTKDVAGFRSELGEASFDDGFVLLHERSMFALLGAGLRVSVEMLGGYTHAQVFAPPGKDQVALEPMTAPANALVSGHGLRVVEAGGTFRAAFRIGVEETRKP